MNFLLKTFPICAYLNRYNFVSEIFFEHEMFNYVPVEFVIDLVVMDMTVIETLL